MFIWYLKNTRQRGIFFLINVWHTAILKLNQKRRTREVKRSETRSKLIFANTSRSSLLLPHNRASRRDVALFAKYGINGTDCCAMGGGRRSRNSVLHLVGRRRGIIRVWTCVRDGGSTNLGSTVVRVYSQQLDVDERVVLTFPLRGRHRGHRLRNSLRKLAVDGGVSCDNNK